MPALETIVNSGVIGNLATISPPLSPMVWTSIATGMRADKHGILGFTEPDPDNKRIRPVSSRSRKVKAIWNILTQKNFKTNVVGWWGYVKYFV
jgi:predicted AlkP superfamily phosphohydrolase/phosphomutase